MIKRIVHIFFFLIAVQIVLSQNDVILKPVEIHPPKPGIEQKPKQESKINLQPSIFKEKNMTKQLCFMKSFLKRVTLTLITPIIYIA